VRSPSPSRASYLPTLTKVVPCRFTGALNGWNISDSLDKVRVPSFVINGRKDLAQDFVTADYFWKIKKSKWVTFENSSHVPMWEEREKYNQLVGEWLDSVQ